MTIELASEHHEIEPRAKSRAEADLGELPRHGLRWEHVGRIVHWSTASMETREDC